MPFFLSLLLDRSSTLLRMAPLVSSYTLILHSLLQKEPKTRSPDLGGSQSLGLSVGLRWVRRGLGTHSLQAILLLMVYTVSLLTKVVCQKFLPLHCRTEMRKRYCVECKVSITQKS